MMHMATMTKEELQSFYDKLAALTEAGDESAVRAYVNEQYPRLPEDVRQEIFFNTMLDTLKEETREEAALLQVQEQGLAAADELMRAKAELEKRNLTE